MKIKLQFTILAILFCTLSSYAQNYAPNEQSQSNLIIQGNKTIALSTPPCHDGQLSFTEGAGKLSTGELVRIRVQKMGEHLVRKYLSLLYILVAEKDMEILQYPQILKLKIEPRKLEISKQIKQQAKNWKKQLQLHKTKTC